MSKFTRVLLSLIQIVLSLTVIAFCVNAVQNCDVFEQKINFISCIVRVICVGLFAAFYYHSLVSMFSSETVFIPLHLIFSIVAEVRILDNFASIFHFYVIPPVEYVNVFIFSTYMGVFTLIGYCLFSSESDQSNATIYLISTSVVSFIFTMLLPKAQNFVNLNKFNLFNIIVYILYAVALFSCIMLHISSPPEGFVLRHLILFLLIMTNYINLFYNSLLMNVIGTALSLLASVLMIITTHLNIIRF